MGPSEVALLNLNPRRSSFRFSKCETVWANSSGLNSPSASQLAMSLNSPAISQHSSHGSFLGRVRSPSLSEGGNSFMHGFRIALCVRAYVFPRLFGIRRRVHGNLFCDSSVGSVDLDLFCLGFRGQFSRQLDGFWLALGLSQRGLVVFHFPVFTDMA